MHYLLSGSYFLLCVVLKVMKRIAQEEQLLRCGTFPPLHSSLFLSSLFLLLSSRSLSLSHQFSPSFLFIILSSLCLPSLSLFLPPPLLPSIPNFSFFSSLLSLSHQSSPSFLFISPHTSSPSFFLSFSLLSFLFIFLFLSSFFLLPSTALFPLIPLFYFPPLSFSSSFTLLFSFLLCSLFHLFFLYLLPLLFLPIAFSSFPHSSLSFLFHLLSTLSLLFFIKSFVVAVIIPSELALSLAVFFLHPILSHFCIFSSLSLFVLK